MSRLNSNQVLGLVLGIVAIVYTVVAFRIPPYPLPRPVDSDTFPKLLGSALLILSVFLYYEKPDPHPAPDDEGPTSTGLAGPGTRIVVTSVAIVIYALSLDTLGFVLCSWVLSSGLAYFYGYRKHLANIVTIGVVVNGLYLLMTRTLDVYLPNAPLPY